MIEKAESSLSLKSAETDKTPKDLKDTGELENTAQVHWFSPQLHLRFTQYLDQILMLSATPEMLRRLEM